MKSNTKLRFLKSALVIVMLLSLAAAGTLAIFTSSVSIDGNVVTAGKVSVDANLTLNGATSYDRAAADNKVAATEVNVGGAKSYELVSGAEASLVLGANGKHSVNIDRIVPGDAVDLQLDIVNNSNVKVAYKVILNVTDATLLPVLALEFDDAEFVATENGSVISTDWIMWGSGTTVSHEFMIGMDLSAGNSYQEKSLEFSISVYAVQANAVDTEYVVFASDVEAINAATSGATVFLTNNITLTGDVVITNPVNIDLGGFALTARTITFVNNAVVNVRIENGILVATGKDANDVGIKFAYVNGHLSMSKVTMKIIEGATVLGDVSQNTLVLDNDVKVYYINTVADLIEAPLTITGKTRIVFTENFENKISGLETPVVIAIASGADENVKIVNQSKTSNVVVVLPSVYTHELKVEQTLDIDTGNVLAIVMNNSKIGQTELVVEGGSAKIVSTEIKIENNAPVVYTVEIPVVETIVNNETVYVVDTEAQIVEEKAAAQPTAYENVTAENNAVLATPSNIVFDVATGALSWSEVEHAERYEVCFYDMNDSLVKTVTQTGHTIVVTGIDELVDASYKVSVVAKSSLYRTSNTATKVYSTATLTSKTNPALVVDGSKEFTATSAVTTGGSVNFTNRGSTTVVNLGQPISFNMVTAEATYLVNGVEYTTAVSNAKIVKSENDLPFASNKLNVGTFNFYFFLNKDNGGKDTFVFDNTAYTSTTTAAFFVNEKATALIGVGSNSPTIKFVGEVTSTDKNNSIIALSKGDAVIQNLKLDMSEASKIRNGNVASATRFGLYMVIPGNIFLKDLVITEGSPAAHVNSNAEANGYTAISMNNVKADYFYVKQSAITVTNSQVKSFLLHSGRQGSMKVNANTLQLYLDSTLNFMDNSYQKTETITIQREELYKCTYSDSHGTTQPAELSSYSVYEGRSRANALAFNTQVTGTSNWNSAKTSWTKVGPTSTPTEATKSTYTENSVSVTYWLLVITTNEIYTNPSYR